MNLIDKYNAIAVVEKILNKYGFTRENVVTDEIHDAIENMSTAYDIDKTTGIVRRFDDLGRILIPREVRRKFNLTDGTPMEICTDENSIILRKYEE